MNAANGKRLRAAGRRVLAGLGSFRLSFGCLIGLLLLTWLGTLYQVEHGLYAAQRAYFESFVVFQRLGDLFVGSDSPKWLEKLPVAVPLPGGMLLMSLLAINLVFGGFCRLLRLLLSGTRVVPRLGVLVVHVGIAILLLAGFVRFHGGVEGSITLVEGQVARSYQSFHEWELAIRRQVADGEVEEHLIPGERFFDCRHGPTFTSPRLPFELVVEHAARNAEPRAVGGDGGGERPLVAGGFALLPKPLQPENERNVAGCVVAVRPAGDGPVQRAVLCGTDQAPWTVEAKGDRFAVQLRKKTYPLPFALRLERFEAEMYPGTNKPRSFQSDVTVIETGAPHAGAGHAAPDRRRVRIQMNEPLRHGDLAIYQSNWGQQGSMPGAPLFSGFQVVSNPADRWPLLGCIVIALGMLLTFGWTLVRYVGRETRRTAPALGLAAACGFALAGGAAAQTQAAADPMRALRTQAWEPAVVATFARLPVQDDGRIKPFFTHVSYLLLRLNGRRSVHLPDDARLGALAGTTLSPVEWAMDVLLFPEQADLYPVFQVQTSEVIDAIELPGANPSGKRKRDRYSMTELRPGLRRLLALGERYGHIPEKERTGIEEQIVALARNVADYERLVRGLDPARLAFPVQDSATLRELFGGREWVRWSDLVERWSALLQARDRLLGRRDLEPAAKNARDTELAILTAMSERAQSVSAAETLLHWIPPFDRTQSAWLAAGELAGTRGEVIRARGGDLAPTLAVLRHHERLLDLRQEPAAFARELAALADHLTHELHERKEGARLGLEVSYLQTDYAYRALCAFGLAFLLASVGWLRPRNRWLGRGTWLLTGLGAGILIAGMAVRCVLRERPPISGLYDTILFVTGAMVLSGLVVELFHRRGVILSLVALLGFTGMFLAGRFETSDGQDTMPTLQAVLDTNFWLATHVTVINLGYAGTLLAGFLAHVVLLGRLLPGRRREQPAAVPGLARAIYGTICFATLFTTVGTILGGIWANDSWGRFWGWDPKENGALMIVLWNLAILHGRLGGIVRDHGIAMMAVAGNVVVVFSWFHTNLLGVGLHSYGFASGLSTAVWTFYALEAAVLVLGHVTRRRDRHSAGAALAST